MRVNAYLVALIFLASCGGSTEPLPPLPGVSTSPLITVTFASGQRFLMDSTVPFTLTNGGASAIQVTPSCSDTTQIMAFETHWNGSAWVNIVQVCPTNHAPITLQPGQSHAGTYALRTCPGPAALDVDYTFPGGSGTSYSTEFAIQAINPSAAEKANCGL